MAIGTSSKPRGVTTLTRRRRWTSGGFSLVEMVVVIVLMAIIAAIAVPRLSRGAAGASEAALTGDLSNLRRAIELYAAEHGGVYPSLASIAKQLTQYSDASGGCVDSPDQTHIFGPYLRTIPPLPAGTRRGQAGIAGADGPKVGWIYDPATGAIQANDGKTATATDTTATATAEATATTK